jgi:hypothetical protein
MSHLYWAKGVGLKLFIAGMLALILCTSIGIDIWLMHGEDNRTYSHYANLPLNVQ